MASEQDLPLHCLVVYKKRPARAVQVLPRLEIELEDGNRAKVRAKDVLLLHPGPVNNLKELKSQPVDLQATWLLLSEDPQAVYTLPELAEWIYGEFTPATAWTAWMCLEDGLYFSGPPNAITPHTYEIVQREQASRQKRQQETRAWQEFLARIQSGEKILEDDRRFLRETEDMALGRRPDSRLMRELGRSQRPENAHALLVSCGYWQPTTNPYPARSAVSTLTADFNLPVLPDENRLDLTGLEAFAIDDRQNLDPDDAISLENLEISPTGELLSGNLWVHVADVAALVRPDTEIDLEARNRGATLYLPEGQVPMLPPQIIESLGLGLQPVSPALSFRISLNNMGEILEVEIQPSWVKVQRLSYEQAEEQLGQGTLHGLDLLCQTYLGRRQANGASIIDLPEVMIHAESGQVEIRPIVRLRSRDMVREAMLMAGEGAARFAIERKIPFPFATQEGSYTFDESNPTQSPSPASSDLAGSYNRRRSLKRSQVSSLPSPHAGVGLPAYSRATSPLRRYLDLAVHQQLRAYLGQRALLSQQEILARVGISETATASINTTESLSRRHWTLIYLMQHPGWRGQAVLVEKNGSRGKVILPELALETSIHLSHDTPLNTTLQVFSTGVNLPELEAFFQEE